MPCRELRAVTLGAATDLNTKRFSRNFKGTLPFLVSDDGELFRTTESSASGAFYLSYDSYMMLKEYADNSKEMCDNLDLQKQAVVNKLKNTIQKVVVAVRDNTK